VVRYDTRDDLFDVLDDVTCVRLLQDIMDWASTHPLLRRLADTRRIYMAGHSRGGKLAALTAAADPRVAALCLLDPVDVTKYAPLSDRSVMLVEIAARQQCMYGSCLLCEETRERDGRAQQQQQAHSCRRQGLLCHFKQSILHLRCNKSQLPGGHHGTSWLAELPPCCSSLLAADIRQQRQPLRGWHNLVAFCQWQSSAAGWEVTVLLSSAITRASLRLGVVAQWTAAEQQGQLPLHK
jgi:pimeloyl-ACP methyl ester carboxylesterase